MRIRDGGATRPLLRNRGAEKLRARVVNGSTSRGPNPLSDLLAKPGPKTDN